MLFCESSKHYALQFIRNLGFKKEKFPFVIIRKQGTYRSLFNLQDKTSHVSSLVCDGKCDRGENYISETWRNVTIGRDEHSDIGKNSEPTKHFYQFSKHRLNWKSLRRVPNKVRQRKIHEEYYVMYLTLPLIINWSYPLWHFSEMGSCRKMFLNYF